jgi:ribosomal protein S6--L-glutamate ligase
VRIGVLSRNSALYSTRRLIQAALARGHDAFLIDTLGVAAALDHPAVGRRPALPVVDAIIPRIGTSVTAAGLRAVRAFEAAGVTTTATAAAIALSRDKARSLGRLEQAGIAVPRTIATWRLKDVAAAVEAVGGLPVVVKLRQGTQGRGVLLAHTLATIRAIAAALQQAGEKILIQEYIAESAGKDTRVIVVDRRCVAAMERSAAPGDFRSNLHRGGTAIAIAISPVMEALAVEAALALDIQVGGVDIIHSSRGPLVVEVNSSPGLEGIERATGRNVAQEIVAYLEVKTGGMVRRPRRAHRRPAR